MAHKIVQLILYTIKFSKYFTIIVNSIIDINLKESVFLVPCYLYLWYYKIK